MNFLTTSSPGLSCPVAIWRSGPRIPTHWVLLPSLSLRLPWPWPWPWVPVCLHSDFLWVIGSALASTDRWVIPKSLSGPDFSLSLRLIKPPIYWSHSFWYPSDIFNSTCKTEYISFPPKSAPTFAFLISVVVIQPPESYPLTIFSSPQLNTLSNHIVIIYLLKIPLI